MDIIYSYFTPLVEKINLIFWWKSSSSTPDNSSTANQNETETSESSNKNDIPGSNPPQTCLFEVQNGSSPVRTTVNTHSGHYDNPHILSQYLNSFSGHDETAEVDKINIIVRCAGKTMEVNIYPLESISVLLKEACDLAEKKPEKMSLVYEGNRLHVNKSVSQYGLRGGTTVHLIHV